MEIPVMRSHSMGNDYSRVLQNVSLFALAQLFCGAPGGGAGSYYTKHGIRRGFSARGLWRQQGTDLSAMCR